jgi:thioredoxin reductase
MIVKEFDCVIIGGGSAGMSAALEVDRNGYSTAIIEREDYLGGVLIQCIHNGFGLHEFKEELTGPEYAERFGNMTASSGIKVFLETTAMDIKPGEGADERKRISCYSKIHGVFIIAAKTVVLAMGCRERNRGNLAIPGTRPAGIFTAGLAQRLINIDGYLPGKDVVILGSGDIGLIMARRLKWSGCNVHAVIEIQKYPSGLTRNIVQCLNDFDIPLYLSHTISEIYGTDRVEKVSVVPINDGTYEYGKRFDIGCDTILLSVGLVPENELSKKAGVEISRQYNGPSVDSTMMTSVDGIFACGNVLHVHDLVDYVTEESGKTGMFVVRYLKGILPASQVKLKAGANVRYLVPNSIDPETDNKVYLRPMMTKNEASIEIKSGDKPVKSVKLKHIQPSEMISVNLNGEDLKGIGDDAVCEFSVN